VLVALFADNLIIQRSRWLVSKGRDAEALEALGKLRQIETTDPRIQREWFDIGAEVAFHKETSALRHPSLQHQSSSSWIKFGIASWTDCLRWGRWRRTYVGMGLMFFQQSVGINALIHYSPTLFQSLNLNHIMQLIISGLLNVTQLLESPQVFGRWTGLGECHSFSREASS